MADPDTFDPNILMGSNGAFPPTASAFTSNGTHPSNTFSPHLQPSVENFQAQDFGSATYSPPATAMPSANGNASTFDTTGQYSAATAEVLRRMSENAAAHAGTPGYEAAREQILKGIVTVDKLPVPPPMAAGKRGRGGRGGTSRGDSLARASATPGTSNTPETTRGRPRGRPRGRGRGRGTGRGGKRKREDSEVEASDVSLSDDEERVKGDDDDEMSDSYTPLPTKTKSGRSITKPTQFVPTIPSPSSGPKKKRPYRRNPESALCKICNRGVSPPNNQVVFCDGCGGAYHQYCHDPPIDKEVILVPEKEWFCAQCIKERNETIAGTTLEGLISGEKMTNEQKRNYLSTLDNSRLADLLIHATALHPSLPLFPKTQPASSAPTQPNNAFPTPSTASAPQAPSISEQPAPTALENQQPSTADQYDGYDTDPPAHYPKPGHGLESTLPPESEDPFLDDTNTFVFDTDDNYAANHADPDDVDEDNMQIEDESLEVAYRPPR